jgi:signal transduction histidine kinase
VNEATFQRTLVNLALNARDAMPEGGDLTLVLREPDPAEADADGCVAIDVVDTGHGIPEELRERIFEPF